MIENYIFDLYGTLLKIHTDQNKPQVWKTIRRHYALSGALWTREGMKRAYYRFCEEEEEKLRNERILYPEIDLKTVFERLYDEAPVHFRRADSSVNDEWIAESASLFRTASREIFEPYRNTMYVLHKLKKQKKGVWLLSNAQTLFTLEELKMTGLYDLFDGIYISSEKGIKKPQKEFMEAMLEEYGIQKETAVMIGNDIAADIGIAAQCGVPSVFLNTDGYTAEEIRNQAKKTVPDPSCKVRIIMSGDIAELLNTGE